MRLAEQASRLALDDPHTDPESDDDIGDDNSRSGDPHKSTKASNKSIPKGRKAPAATGKAASSTSQAASGSAATSSAAKSKRVRTGCLTCRERHLKCDEGMPVCVNCVKSNRVCRRGVRLNFIDTKVEDPQIIPPDANWNVGFQDESREIASEYRGGAGRYAVVAAEDMEEVQHEPHVAIVSAAAVPVTTSTSRRHSANMTDDQTHASRTESELAPPPMPRAPIPAHQTLPPIQSPPQHQQQQPPQNHLHQQQQQHARAQREVVEEALAQHTRASISPAHSTQSAFTPPSQQSYAGSDVDSRPTPSRACLTTAEETLFMQVFVEEVGLWMDSMDPHKHFSRVLPFYALNEPMLFHAMLACGARHLTLVNPAFQEDRALQHYNTATMALLRSLQNPNRDTVVCATAAVILNVYEVMSEKALQRMNHIAGSRALIKECGWNATSTGIGSACFWLNVGLEMLSCLHFNWQVAWNPKDWGLDMEMPRETVAGREEIWTHKILYILARVANFRASIPRFQEANPTLQALRTKARCDEWDEIKALCNLWDERCPRTMQPLAILPPLASSTSGSTFPEIWVIKRTSIVARMFYDTAMCLLAQIHPTISVTGDMYNLQMHHAHQICGIVAHTKDRGVASASLRCIAIAAEVLTDFQEQCEVLTIFGKIQKETGFRIDFMVTESKRRWGWTDEYVRQQQERLQMQQQQSQAPPSTNTPPVEHGFGPATPGSIGVNSTSQSSTYATNLPSPHSAPSLPPPPPPPPMPILPSHQTSPSHLPPSSLPSTLPPINGSNLAPIVSGFPPPQPPPGSGAPPSQSNGPAGPSQNTSSQSSLPSPPKSGGMPSFPRGIVNPLMRTADFSGPQHPYQSHYVPPNPQAGPQLDPFSHFVQMHDLAR